MELQLSGSTSTVKEKNFSNSLTINREKIKEITFVKEAWMCAPNYYQKIWLTFALNVAKNYEYI